MGTNNVIPLIPARIINEYMYCPRLAYLEWVHDEWEDSADTIKGQYVHRNVNKQRRGKCNTDKDNTTAKIYQIKNGGKESLLL